MSAIDLPNIGPPENSSSEKPDLPLPGTSSDQDFRDAFEALKIPSDMFHHREHLRVAWIYSRHFAYEQALPRILQGIQAFAKHHAANDKYHHTITVAWARLVSQAVRSAPHAPDFNTFATTHPHLLNPRLLEDYYSTGRLQSDAARRAWIEPDLRSLP